VNYIILTHLCRLNADAYFTFQIYVSKKWGFTKYDRAEYETLKEDGRLAPDGANVKFRPDHGPLDNWRKVQRELLAV